MQAAGASSRAMARPIKSYEMWVAEQLAIIGGKPKPEPPPPEPRPPLAKKRLNSETILNRLIVE